jgi:hypothetical protein
MPLLCEQPWWFSGFAAAAAALLKFVDAACFTAV